MHEFAAGAGNELKGKMRAPWSSSALAVNAFLPWRVHEEPVDFLGLGPLAPRFAFERKCPNKVSSTPPHLDVLFDDGRGVIAVESKCTEFVQGGTHAAVSSRYLRLADGRDSRASSRWFAALKHAEDFPLLDAYQLVKHYLGLRNEYPKHDLTLIYLYWEPTNAKDFRPFIEHRKEVVRFSGLVHGDQTCRFVAGTYSDVRQEWQKRTDLLASLSSRLDNFGDRYLLDV